MHTQNLIKLRHFSNVGQIFLNCWTNLSHVFLDYVTIVGSSLSPQANMVKSKKCVIGPFRCHYKCFLFLYIKSTKLFV